MQAWERVGAALGAPRWPRISRCGWLRRLVDMGTVGEAAEHVASRMPTILKRSGEGWAWSEVAWVVTGVVRDLFGFKTVPLDAEFVRDLGID